MNNAQRIALPIVAALSAGLVAGPALAATPTSKPSHDRSTNILVKAAKASVAPKHKDTLTATLKSAKARLAGETLYLEQRDVTTHKFSDPTAIGTTDQHGQLTIPVTPGNKKGTKVKYRVVFLGNTGYKASYSKVITVTISPES